MTKKYGIRRYTSLAMFAALAYASLFVVKIGGIGGFLTFDAKDAVITVAAFAYGPVAGCVISVLVALLEMVTVSSTGIWGFIMNAIASATFAAAGSVVYFYIPKLKKTFSGAVVGLTLSVVLTTGVMLLMNLLITPIYTGMSVGTIAGMIPALLLPFNLIKTVINAALVLVLYKPLATALRKTGAIPAESVSDGGDGSYRFGKREIIVLIAAVAVIAVCTVLLVIVFKGSIGFFGH